MWESQWYALKVVPALFIMYSTIICMYLLVTVPQGIGVVTDVIFKLKIIAS